MRLTTWLLVGALASLASLGLAGCGGSSAVKVTGLQIVTASGGPMTAQVGDALMLAVMETLADGTSQALPSSAMVTWTDPMTVTALAPESTDPNPIPTPGPSATAFFVDNPGRPDRNADLPGVVFFSDAGAGGGGSVDVAVTVGGVAGFTQATASIAVSAAPTGDASRGATLFGSGGPDCAACHGATADGSPLVAGSTTMYTVGTGTYPYPAPGLNALPGNVAADPTWSGPKLAIAARSDMRNTGVTLRDPMPDWLSKANPVTQQALSTQDLIDIYTFLGTQTQ